LSQKHVFLNRNKCGLGEQEDVFLLNKKRVFLFVGRHASCSARRLVVLLSKKAQQPAAALILFGAEFEQPW